MLANKMLAFAEDVPAPVAKEMRLFVAEGLAAHASIPAVADHAPVNAL
jgi:hypothetical protein